MVAYRHPLAPSRRLLLALALATLSVVGGCRWMDNSYQQLRGDGFPEWNQSLSGARGDTSTAKPSGHFTDRRSDQIEQSLGGGF